MIEPTSELPYGAWPSPLTPDAMAAGTLRFAGVRLGADAAVYWLEGRPAEGGRTVLVRGRPGEDVTDVVPPSLDVRSRVHEYGGGAFCLGEGGERFVVNASDQAIYRVGDGPPRCLSPGAPEWRFGDLVFDRAHQRLLAVAERRTVGAAEPANLLVAVPLEGGPPQVLAAGADFYASPAPSADGRQLAFVCWDHPHLPWDAGALHVAELGADGRPRSVRHVAGSPAASAQQPAFGPDGALYFLWEPAGAWNLFRWTSAAGAPVAIAPGPGELGLPPWGLGLSTWGFLDQRTVLAAEIHQGVTQLVRLDVERGERTALATPVAAVSQLVTDGRGRAAALASFPDRPPAVVLMDGGGGLQILRSASATALDPADVSHARPFRFPTSGGDQAHGFFYAPRNQRVTAPAGVRPPLLLLVHGGPTAAVTAGYSPAIQFWTTRGFAVFDLNYRGSSGYGRAYRDRLRGQWGVYDVEDAGAAARALAQAGWVDGKRMAIRGSSAGGFTVLAALCADDTFQAGSSLYGVSDLQALARDTHKFESRYCDGLVGPWPARADLYQARSPLAHADRFACPVIFFQGLEDRVVPPDQTERLVAALRARGLPVECHSFPGEQHGFRRADTIRTVYERELSFFGRVFGLSGNGP